MAVVLVVLLVLLVMAVLAIGVVMVREPRGGIAGPQAAAPAPVTVVEGGRAVIVLDLTDVDATSAAAQRLVDEAASRAFAALPDAIEIEVRDQTGAVLGRRRRETPREVEIPPDLYAPSTRRHSGPDLSDISEPSGVGTLPSVRQDPDPVEGAHRQLAERFELPETVAARIDDPDDAVAIVRAILEAGGHGVEVDGDLIRAADHVVIVVRTPIGEPLGRELLNRAYLRFSESGAPRGILVTPGFMDPSDVRRREVFAPTFSHAGPDGIQRMADAVALRADPLRFAAAPPFGAA